MKTCFAIFLLGMLLLAAGCDPQRVARLEAGVSTSAAPPSRSAMG